MATKTDKYQFKIYPQNGHHFMLYTKLHIFSIQFALSDNNFADFAWLVKEFRIYNIRFQKNFSHGNPQSGLTHSKIPDYFSFIWFCGFIYLVINFQIQSNKMSDYGAKESIM